MYNKNNARTKEREKIRESIINEEAERIKLVNRFITLLFVFY